MKKDEREREREIRWWIKRETDRQVREKETKKRERETDRD